MIMRILQIIFIGGIVSVAGTTQAQETLADHIDEQRLHWIFGEWEGETDDGETVEVSYSWGLNQNLVMGQIKTDDWEGKSFTALDPASDVVKYVGMDDRGIYASGVWEAEDGKAILKYGYETPRGESGRVGVVHSRIDDQTMKVELHGLSGNDDLVQPARATILFDRTK
jgi:hypothetical protein